MPPPSSAKIFGIGFQKTGTTTLKTALQVLGYKVKGGGRDLIGPIRQGNLAPVYRMAEAYDAFEDHPWPQLFRALDRQFPGCKFILTLRDEGKWIDSVVNHLGFFSHPMQVLTYGVGYPAGYEDVFLQRYREHNHAVLAHFKDRPEDLLVVNWEDGGGWDMLCPFLGIPVPTVEFPHVNKGSYHPAKRMLWRAGSMVIRTHRRMSRIFH